MAYEAGVIKYEVEAGTASLLKAEAQVNKSISKVVDEFDRADRAVREFESTQKSLGRTINSMGQVVNKNGKIVAASTIEYRNLAAQAQQAFERTSTASAGATSAFKLQKGASQQLGFQLQDMAVQAQMGISAFTILGQQGSQLAGVFGPGGALVGAAIAVASAIGGVMYAALSKTEKKIEDVTYKTESYKEKLDSLTFSQAQASIVKFRDENKQLSDQLQVADNTMGRLTQQSRMLSLQLNDEGKFTGKSAKENEKKYKQLQKDLVTAEANYDTIKQQIKENDEAVKSLTDAQDRYRKGLQNTGTETKRNTDEIKSMIDALNLQAATLGMTERGIALYIAEQMRATQIEKDAINAQYDKIEAYKNEQDEMRETMRMLEEFSQFEEEQAAKRSKLTTQVASIGLTPLEEIQKRYEQELALLVAAEEQKILTKEEFAAREKVIEEEKKQAIKGLNKTVQDELTKSLEAMQTQAIGAFTQFITGAQNGSEAIRGLANSVLNIAIGALVKMAMQAVVGQKTVEATTITSAGVISSALATPAALMSLATAGANSAPAMAGITSTVGLANGMALAGGREFGGPVNSGSMYRVGERGPEIFTSGGRQYMIPGESGQVTNNITNGGEVSVIVNNNAPGTMATAQQSSDGKSVEVTINEINRQVREGRGSFVSNLKQNTNLQFKAGR